MKYLSFLVAILLLACKQPVQQQKTASTVKFIPAKPKTADSDVIKYRQLYRDDSIQSTQLLSKALAYAKSRTYSTGYEKSLGDSAVVLKFGDLFADGNKYLVVERTPHGFSTSVDLFIWTDAGFKSVNNGSTDNLSFSYLEYNIRDVDGDHKKDFLIHVYPSSGCCRRDVYWVYLYKQKGKFSSKYEFINPTFSPTEHVIRGVDYGHPGDAPLYKYKWNGDKVDTIEFIYRADTLGEKFYHVRHSFDVDNTSTRRLLNALPSEYRKIESIEWFLMNE